MKKNIRNRTNINTIMQLKGSNDNISRTMYRSYTYL